MVMKVEPPFPPIPISPTWKLYNNPFYIFHQQQPHTQIHTLHLPISSRKIAASFSDLSFIKPHMDSDERKARKKRLARELAEMVKMKRDMEEERKMLRTAEERLQMKVSQLQIKNGDDQRNSLMTKEAENPHIKRGIKGFVEFPKVVKAIGCTSSKHLGSKLECQKAQLKILLKQKGPLRFSGLIAR
ncbi:protein BRANCHLESS TRICHOME-like [Salvia splendens]|uniref:protein BRANCHLESS TRICHOME-like n=1 Tax=Salvia splendens TaxID=180675 RepID=UPI001C25C2C9|nr:protein BRANCHLESS TRICHOME-like [Salvia splendens]